MVAAWTRLNTLMLACVFVALVAIAALLAGKVRPTGPVAAILSGRNIDMDAHRSIVCRALSGGEGGTS